MGSGSSKGDNVVKFEDSDDEDWSKEAKQRAEQKKEVSVIGRVFGKPKPAPAPTLSTRKIVGESSSSDEEDEYYRDVQLRKDINQLERALNNVDTQFDDNNHKSLRDFRHKHNRDISAPMLRHEEYHGHPTRLAASDGLSGGNNKVKYKQARKKSDLKFSWEDREARKINEDWTLQKVKIDGFDPAKFKAANNKTGAMGSKTDIRVGATTISSNSQMNSVPSFAEPPGFVPTYDHSEQQLLASLERELGV